MNSGIETLVQEKSPAIFVGIETIYGENPLQVKKVTNDFSFFENLGQRKKMATERFTRGCAKYAETFSFSMSRG